MTKPNHGQFCVGVTRDFLNQQGEVAFGDIGLSLFAQSPNVQWEFLQEEVPEPTPDQMNAYDALLVLTPRVTARSLGA
jgi:hypothetical protein